MRSSRRAGRRRAFAGACRGRPRGPAGGVGRSTPTRAPNAFRRLARRAHPDREGGLEREGPRGARTRAAVPELPPDGAADSPASLVRRPPHSTPCTAVLKGPGGSAAASGSRGGLAGRADRPGARRPASRWHRRLPPPPGTVEVTPEDVKMDGRPTPSPRPGRPGADAQPTRSREARATAPEGTPVANCSGADVQRRFCRAGGDCCNLLP